MLLPFHILHREVLLYTCTMSTYITHPFKVDKNIVVKTGACLHRNYVDNQLYGGDQLYQQRKPELTTNLPQVTEKPLSYKVVTSTPPHERDSKSQFQWRQPLITQVVENQTTIRSRPRRFLCLYTKCAYCQIQVKGLIYLG